MTFDRLVMVLGAPRSGTSWLGKIFDSHPDVLYRHEPDLALWERRLPFLIPEHEVANYTAIAADYVTRLISTPTLKSAGQLPTFPKSYYSPGKRALHTGLIRTLRWLEGATRSRRMRAYRVPDLTDAMRDPRVRIVLKSISARGRARVFLEALPGMTAILLLRHPCGQVASTLRGLRQGRFDTGVFVKDVLSTPGADTYGLTEKRLNAASQVEQLAWHWATMNELAAGAMHNRANASIACYEDICRDPIGRARELLAFGGLDWNRQTEAFVGQSTTYAGPEKYYSVFRNAVDSAERWRTELPETDQRSILDIVAQTSLARFWSDTSGGTTPRLQPEPQTAST